MLTSQLPAQQPSSPAAQQPSLLRPSLPPPPKVASGCCNHGEDDSSRVINKQLSAMRLGTTTSLFISSARCDCCPDALTSSFS